MQLYLEGGTWFKKKSSMKKISFLVDWSLSERAIKCQQASWPEDDVKPLRPLYTFTWSTWFWQGSGLLTPRDSVFIPMYNKKYISKPENKENRSVSGKTYSPVSFLSCSLFFWLNSHLDHGCSSSLLIFPWLLSSTQEGAQGGAPSTIQVGAGGLRRWCKFLVLEFYWFST